MLTTFLAVVDAKLPINLTCSLAFAQNLLGNLDLTPFRVNHVKLKDLTLLDHLTLSKV